MRTNFVRLLENALAPDDDASRPAFTELDALKMAKARQDVSHHRLDKWIAAAIAELSVEGRTA
jgi:hypothetical protein